MQELLDERAQTHGPFEAQWTACQDIKATLDLHGLRSLPAIPREALENISSKKSRILCGNAMHAEHWDDIAGYAMRVAEWIRTQQAAKAAAIQDAKDAVVFCSGFSAEYPCWPNEHVSRCICMDTYVAAQRDAPSPI